MSAGGDSADPEVAQEDRLTDIADGGDPFATEPLRAKRPSHQRAVRMAYRTRIHEAR